MLKTIFGDPIQHPRRKVRAFVGQFASDFLGDYDSPAKAVAAARKYGYKIVHVIYLNGDSDAIDLTKG